MNVLTNNLTILLWPCVSKFLWLDFTIIVSCLSIFTHLYLCMYITIYNILICQGSSLSGKEKRIFFFPQNYNCNSHCQVVNY